MQIDASISHLRTVPIGTTPDGRIVEITPLTEQKATAAKVKDYAAEKFGAEAQQTRKL
jgi:hypothetical protein